MLHAILFRLLATRNDNDDFYISYNPYLYKQQHYYIFLNNFYNKLLFKYSIWQISHIFEFQTTRKYYIYAVPRNITTNCYRFFHFGAKYHHTFYQRKKVPIDTNTYEYWRKNFCCGWIFYENEKELINKQKVEGTFWYNLSGNCKFW